MGQNFGFVKVAAAIPRVEIADCIYNEREIYNQIIEAVHRNVQIIVFPELSITAYTCGDYSAYAFIGTGSERLCLCWWRKLAIIRYYVSWEPVAAGNCFI